MDAAVLHNGRLESLKEHKLERCSLHQVSARLPLLALLWCAVCLLGLLLSTLAQKCLYQARVCPHLHLTSSFFLRFFSRKLHLFASVSSRLRISSVPFSPVFSGLRPFISSYTTTWVLPEKEMHGPDKIPWSKSFGSAETNLELGRS
jgi:hypothetical protein